MKNRWGVLLIFVALILSLGFYLPGLPEALSTSLFDGSTVAYVDIFGIILCFVSAIMAWVSFPRVHNFRMSWLGVLMPALFLIYYVLGMIPKTAPRFDNSVAGELFPLYISGILVLIHLVMFLILPDSAKRRTLVLTIGIYALAQTLLVTLLVLFGNDNVQFPYIEGSGFNQRYFLLIVYSLFLGVALFVTLRYQVKRYHHYLGGLIISLIVFSILFIIRKFFGYDNLPFGWTSKILGVYFVGMMLLMDLGILSHWFNRIEQKVKYDPLLKIYNRQYCLQILEEKSNIKTTPPFTIAMLDIDHFKKVNDTYGHKAGDDVLFAVAQRVQQIIIPAGNVTRYGGEELVLFFSNKDRFETQSIMEQVRIAIQSMKVKSGKKTIAVTVSSGICERPDNVTSLEKVLMAADKALYKAKDDGRNCVKVARLAATQNKKSSSKEEAKAIAKQLPNKTSSTSKSAGKKAPAPNKTSLSKAKKN